MMLFLKKNLSFPPFSRAMSNKNPTFSLFFFSSASETQNPPPKSHFMVEYLKTSLGFSSDKALKVLKPISHLTSTNKPDSVLQFLKHHGFTGADIRAFVSAEPRILCAEVSKTLEPNLRPLLSLGFTIPEIKAIFACNPCCLRVGISAHRLEFWRSLFNDDKKSLLLAFKRNPGIMRRDIDKSIAPKIALLKEHGLSETDIQMLITRGHCFITRRMSSIEALLKRVKELGLSPSYSMYGYCLSSLSSIGSARYKAKVELFRSFGWSEEQFLDAFKKTPYFIQFTEEKIRKKMNFLVGSAGCTRSYIASHPAILTYSLEKRLMPRHHVMKILKLNELVGKEWDLTSIMNLAEQNFIKKFILPFEVEAPMLRETYLAAACGKVPL